MNPRALLIYTDGSAKPKNPGPGGVGVRFVFPDFLEKGEMRKDLKFSGYKSATNNQMELMACILGLKEAQKLEEIKSGAINCIAICTDSQYVKDNIDRAIYVWSKRSWKSESGSPILNTSLWKDLIRKMKKLPPVEFEKVKAHSGNEDNEAANRLARQAAERPAQKPLYNQIVRRKSSKEITQRGSVEMLGQRIRIKIISSQYLSGHKESQIRYEVTSPKSKYYGKVDILFSKITLRPPHEYLVVLGKDMKYPKVERVIREIENKSAEC
ncbi:MAG: ribonuclease HI [Candidatus Moranbacteria bacterium]|nr:ribonuclease HI [Candidatus Moranbacteria bacterium]